MLYLFLNETRSQFVIYSYIIRLDVTCFICTNIYNTYKVITFITVLHLDKLNYCTFFSFVASSSLESESAPVEASKGFGGSTEGGLLELSELDDESFPSPSLPVFYTKHKFKNKNLTHFERVGYMN
jgi:hypothetical protein